MKNLRSILSRVRPIHSLVCLASLFASPVLKGQTAALPQESYVPAIDVQIIMPEPNGTQARAVAQVNAGGAIESIKVVDGGSGYSGSPLVTVEAPPGGEGTTPVLGAAVIKEGKIAEIKVEKGGSGYTPTLPPQIVIESPNRRAEARAVLSPDTLTHIEIIDPGSGYVIGEKAGGFAVKFNPKKSAELTFKADAMVGSGLGSVGQQFPVLNGGGYRTLRGLAAPSQGDVMARALGYYAPGDGGGGIFFWNPKREFAMPRQVTVTNGGSDYRPGDVVLLNENQRFLVTEINKRVSAKYPDGLYTDHMEVAHSGKVDVGTIQKLVPVEYKNFNAVPSETKWGNSLQKWSESPNMVVGGWDAKRGKLKITKDGKRSDTELERVFSKRERIRGEKSGATGEIGEVGAEEGQFFITLIESTVTGTFAEGERLLTMDGPGSGAPFVKGSGPLEIDVAWTLDNGGSIINPCGSTASGRWERIYDGYENDIRFFGAIGDTPQNGATMGTDNTWAIQMAMFSSKNPGDPASGKTTFIPRSNAAYLTGTLNYNYANNLKGDGGVLFGKPGLDIIATVQPPIEDKFSHKLLAANKIEGISLIVNESICPTMTGGIADETSYKARRLYKAPRWDKDRNSQRWGTMTFMEAERVSDRRYFGTDDSLDPELAPPLNDREPARRIYHILNDTMAMEKSSAFEYSDRIASLEVDPACRGYGVRGQKWSLDGGVPVLGSVSGPGKYGDKSNFGNLDAGKAQVVTEALFTPETTLSYKPGDDFFTQEGSARTPLLENHRYTFSLKGVVDSDKKPVLFDTLCVRDPLSKNLVLSLGGQKSARKLTDEAELVRSAGAADEFAVANGGKSVRSIQSVLAVYDETGRQYEQGKDFTAVCAGQPKAGITITWKGKRPPEKMKYKAAYAFSTLPPANEVKPTQVNWAGGPLASVKLVGRGSYKHKPGEEPIRELKSPAIKGWDPYCQGGPRLYFDSTPLAASGFTIGMAVSGDASGASGVLKDFGNDGTREYATLASWNLRNFKTGEQIAPRFNTDSRLGVSTLPCFLDESAPSSAAGGPNFQVVFASDNPVVKSLTVTAARTSGQNDLIALSAAGGTAGQKDYYPWKVVKVSDSAGVTYEPQLDFQAEVDQRGQKVVLNWGGDWLGKSPQPKAPAGEYQVELLRYAGSPTYENLPWPEWRALEKTDKGFTFKDAHFLSAKDGRIVVKGKDGTVTGEPLLEGRDYTVDFDAAENSGVVRWKSGKPPAGALYLQYRKAVDDYDTLPWGSPKHLSGSVNGAVLVDAFERFMGNFAFMQQSVNYPGYPPAVLKENHGSTFRDLSIYAIGAIQSTSGGLCMRPIFNGTFENIFIQDTNYGLITPIGLYYPWQNNGVRRDGSVMLRCLYSEGSSAEFGKSWWGGDISAGVGYYPNKMQYIYAYGGGGEQSVFKGFQMRCGDIGIFAVGTLFYKVSEIWASGANSVDRPRGSTMFFGKPANGPEIFSNCVQFGPLSQMFGEQALNGDYAIPVIRCCAAGGGQEIDFSGVTQGRQAIWMGLTKGKAAKWRATILLDKKYGMGIWGPTTLRVSATAGSKRFSIEGVGNAPDATSAIPLRNGATYYVPDLGTGFVYNASRPLNEQELNEAPKVTVSNMVVRVHNSTILKTEFNPIETAKINKHYAWSLLLCGENNQIEVSPPALQDRKRLILEGGGKNRITDGYLNGEK